MAFLVYLLLSSFKLPPHMNRRLCRMPFACIGQRANSNGLRFLHESRLLKAENYS
jgi:hypothetical protein